jgi:hypothetical protein
VRFLLANSDAHHLPTLWTNVVQRALVEEAVARLAFLPVLNQIILAGLRFLAGLQRLVLLATITLLEHHQNRGIDHPAGTRNVALRPQTPAKALEQSLDQAGLRPQGSATASCHPECYPRSRQRKPRERQAGPHLILDVIRLKMGCEPL